MYHKHITTLKYATHVIRILYGYDIMSKKNKNWKSISIRIGICEAIEKFVEYNPNYGSVSEFVNETLRNRLEQLTHTEVPP